MTKNDRILIGGLNWLGDSVMSMPAIGLLKQRYPSSRVTVLARPGLVPLWRLHGAVDDVVGFEAGLVGTLRAGSGLRRRFDVAYIFPNSFRSALIPFLARVPARVGVPGQFRAWMLTSRVPGIDAPARRHQAWEYVQILGLAEQCSDLPMPRLSLPDERVAACREKLGLRPGEEAIGLIPGAARGPAKRWPPEHFAETGRLLLKQFACRLYVFGTKEEQAVCSEIAERAPAVNMAGRTSLTELASMLGLCRVVVGNDSGAAHLAAAVGARVVAVFGITDPERTGPLGEGHRAVSAEGARRGRDIPPRSEEAARWLRSIAPERVFKAAAELFESSRSIGEAASH